MSVHFDAVSGIRTALYTTEEIQAWAAPKKPESYEELIRTKEFFVAEEDEDIVAFGVLNQNSSEVEAVYVSPRAGRRGIGLKMLQKLEERARALGLDQLRLNASLNAVPFYQRAGYVGQEESKYRLSTGVEIACVPMVKAVTRAFELELVAITAAGELAKPVECDSPWAATIVEATVKLYRAVGYEPPWVGYLAFENDSCVGTCGFKSPPQDNRVEIAYFTFPEHESRGIARRMASELIRLALVQMPGVTVAAQTLPEESASTSILKKLNFRLVGSVEHPEDGLVWEWQLQNPSARGV
jgi:GNAT superfamily N-acetyltransferase